ncbi:class I SAM-dependent methyltransferase [Marivirga arenosa]|uniref:Class I SAM-dependent methyltransferase n=1 Tax=Marivirga arenosa TaxID=3059076 RepID=A0AA49GD19_9BACT|nr:class I SAM-dependent methyltransferase [Marivirga sp. BKB1-2]WKK78795.1 class I SAM-dependent methyltransferase [Marivirga sp. BKB1-2]
MNWKEVNHELGNIDLYWLDFILKGYLKEGTKILDAGCGEGRNIHYCLKNQMDVFGIDQNPEALHFLRLIANIHKLDNVEARFQQMRLDKLLFPDQTFDTIICNAVLHFASDTNHFTKMIEEMSRVLKSKGALFIRTMTDLYFSDSTLKLKENIVDLGQKNLRYVINSDQFIDQMNRIGFSLIEPYKEVLVQGKHSMGTFMLYKE